jgi:hypothetical protein
MKTILYNIKTKKKILLALAFLLILTFSLIQ